MYEVGIYSFHRNPSSQREKLQRPQTNSIFMFKDRLRSFTTLSLFLKVLCSLVLFSDHGQDVVQFYDFTMSKAQIFKKTKIPPVLLLPFNVLSGQILPYIAFYQPSKPCRNSYTRISLKTTFSIRYHNCSELAIDS